MHAYFIAEIGCNSVCHGKVLETILQHAFPTSYTPPDQRSHFSHPGFHPL